MAEAMEWADPPPEARRGRDLTPWAEIAEQLRANPGQWAQVPGDHAGGVGSQLRKGHVKPIRPPEHYEVVGRAAEGKGPAGGPRCRLWIRYVGP
jgi:hypothetical protein